MKKKRMFLLAVYGYIKKLNLNQKNKNKKQNKTKRNSMFSFLKSWNL